MIFYGQQTIDEDDIEAVTKVLRSNFLTQGPVVKQFEQAFSTYVGSEAAVACCNGTAALHLACLGLGVGKEDSVWTTAISFVASANCARYCQASVTFIDIDPFTGNMSVAALSKALIEAQQQNSLPKAIIIVHLAGNSCEMEAIYRLCHPLGISIIEDACHALGATYNHKKVGNCQYSDCCVFSFHPVKSITSAEGGMITSNDPKFTQRIRQLASHGISKDPEQLQQDAPGNWYYEQQHLGFNYRLSDVHAALGLNQLNKLDSFITARERIFQHYASAFKDSKLQLLRQNAEGSSAHHLVVALIEKNQRNALYEHLSQQGIICQLHYIPIYRHPYHHLSEASFSDYPGAEHYYAAALSLPIYPNLSTKQQQLIINTILEWMDD